MKAPCAVHESDNWERQSRTQSPQDCWIAVGRKVRLWGIFLIALTCCFFSALISAVKNSSYYVPRNLSRRLTAGQGAWGLWVRDPLVIQDLFRRPTAGEKTWWGLLGIRGWVNDDSIYVVVTPPVGETHVPQKLIANSFGFLIKAKLSYKFKFVLIQAYY